MTEILSAPDSPQSAEALAQLLGETEAEPCTSIATIVQLRGLPWALHVLEKTRDIEAGGGMMTFDKTRRRTFGGVFFFIARRRLKDRERVLVFPGYEPPPKVEKPKPFKWEDRLELVSEAVTQKGEATTVKITLIGRPGKVVVSPTKTFVMTTLEQRKAPALPKGLPAPPATPTLYTVYIAAKKWDAVAQSLVDPLDVLIVEGHPQVDLKTGTISVFALSVTTKVLQKAKREAQLSQTPA